MKKKKKASTRSGELTPSQFVKQLITPPTTIPTMPPGFGAVTSPITPSPIHPQSDLNTEYEQFFQALHDLQGLSDSGGAATIGELADDLLETALNEAGESRPTTIVKPIVEEPEEPKRGGWDELLDQIEETSDDDDARRRGIVDVIPTSTDVLDIFDEIPDTSDDTGDTQTGGEPDDIHDDDEPPAPDTEIKDKLPTGNPSCEEIEDYLSSIGIPASVCGRTGKETRIIGKA